MEKRSTIKIGNAQAFWGDSTEAAEELVRQQPDLDYLTLDYLSEVSLSIMAVQRKSDPETSGYARDFVDVIKKLIPHWNSGSKVKIVTNAGGLEPKRCAEACRDVLRDGGCKGLRIGVVWGDDVYKIITNDSKNPLFNNLETGESINTILPRLSTANAYFGAGGIVDLLDQGVDIVITGRVADPSLTVAPCISHFGWKFDDYDLIAQATVAGHLIECGTQVTGGISNRWLELPDNGNIGFPVVEMESNGHFVITKPKGSGGRVSIETVKEQLLYEIGDPASYKSPDATVSFLKLSLEQQGLDRIAVRGALGSPPPSTYKVSATYADGFKAEGTLSILGHNVYAKAMRCGEIILEKMKRAGKSPEKNCIECLGAGGLVPGIGTNPDAIECVLRVCVADQNRDSVEYFTRLMAPMVTCGPAGTTGYTSGRPHVRSVYGYWPCLVAVNDVPFKTAVLEV